MRDRQRPQLHRMTTELHQRRRQSFSPPWSPASCSAWPHSQCRPALVTHSRQLHFLRPRARTRRTSHARSSEIGPDLGLYGRLCHRTRTSPIRTVRHSERHGHHDPKTRNCASLFGPVSVVEGPVRIAASGRPLDPNILTRHLPRSTALRHRDRIPKGRQDHHPGRSNDVDHWKFPLLRPN